MLTYTQIGVNVLVLCPHPEESGGVAHYYSLVREYFKSDSINLDFFYTGTNSVDGRGSRLFHTLSDLQSLNKTVPQYDLVVLNPSLDAKSILRDGVYHAVAKWIHGKKTAIFFRGWSPKYERIIDRHARGLFRLVFNADRLIILCSRFGNTLKAWGFPANRISQETTTYEHHDYDVPKEPHKIIFLSRFAEGKGCLEAIQTVELLVREFPMVKLYMVGDGDMMSKLVSYVVEQNLGGHVEFTGWLAGEKKYRLLGQCGIMLFPTNYGEGMPNCLVEGIGMGIPIITRPVAGISDIISDGENGFLISSLDPMDFAAKVSYLLRHHDVWVAISERNRTLGRERFAITSVVARLESLYLDLLRQQTGRDDDSLKAVKKA